MSYRIEGKDIVISGFEEGIADNPYRGIADIRNANISSVPGEISVNFKTALRSYASLSSVTISSADTGTEELTITSSPTLETGMTITISGTNLPAPLATSTIYWVTKVSNTKMKLSSSYVFYNAGTYIDITTTGTPGDWTFTTINVGTPKHAVTDNDGNYWMLDSNGRTWRAAGTNETFVYVGNRVPTGTNGNGLIYFEASDGTGYIFVIHNSSIDYTLSASGSIAWVYQWSPSAGTTGAYNATPTQVLKAPLGLSYQHNAILTPDNQAIFCDLNWVDRFYENTGSVFSPTNTATYTWDQTQLLPTTDIAQCLTYLGTDVLVGGQRNVVYSWNGVASVSNNYIFLPETNVIQMVTINTNTFIFCGNRGRIYVTNGVNANLFKKIPDHISGTVEPYFVWGGATFQKNRLYFGFSVTTNSGTNLTTNYKGLWSIDADTGALIGSNQLSPGTAVYASAVIGINPTTVSTGNPAGAGLFIGWGGASSGIDVTSTAPYSSSETYLETDMIPIGTFLNPYTPAQVEWKTSYPVGVNNTAETITLYYRTALNQSFVQIGTTTVTGSSMVSSQNGTTTVATTSGTGELPVAVSDFYQTNFQRAQWVQLKAVLSSNETTPTYCRLTELRIRNS